MKNNQLLQQLDLNEEVRGSAGQSLSLFIGRAQECTIRLEEQAISRNQAELIYSNGVWVIKNLNPITPMYLNNIEVGEIQLNDQIKIKLSDYVFSIDGTVATNESHENETETMHEKSGSNNKPSEETTEKDEAVSGFEIQTDSADGGDDQFNFESEGDEAQASGDQATEGNPLDALDGLESSDEPKYEIQAASENDGDATQFVSSFLKFDLVLLGEYAPYDRYKLENTETFIGRDKEKCQIVLDDPEVSSVHAVVRRKNAYCELEDLKSSNGTFFNGARINKVDLKNEDEFVIGSTTFTLTGGSDFFKQESDRLMPVEQNQVVEVQEIVEVDPNDLDSEGGFESGGQSTADLMANEKSVIKKFLIYWKSAPPIRKILIVVIGMLIFSFIVPSDEPPKKKQTEEEAKSHLLKTEEEKKKTADPEKVKLSPEDEEFCESVYALGFDHHEKGNYREAIFEFEKIFQKTPDYKNARQLYDLSKRGLKQIEDLERQRQAEIEHQQRMAQVETLLVKAREAAREKRLELAEGLFTKILALDPENFEVSQLKMELDSWKKEQERLELERVAKEAERKRQVDLLSPGKNYYLQKEWYKAIIKLEEFLKKTGMDEDLIKEGAKMLTESKNNLNEIIAPLLGKARSLMEGQDLKGAYESFLEILKYDPTHIESLNQMDDIREKLLIRSRKVYREAIISESLHLFDDAKEKFQEVQQISPSDSEYYKRATEKLKIYGI